MKEGEDFKVGKGKAIVNGNRQAVQLGTCFWYEDNGNADCSDQEGKWYLGWVVVSIL